MEIEHVVIVSGAISFLILIIAILLILKNHGVI